MLSVAGTPCIASNFSRVQNSTQRKRIHTGRLKQSLTNSSCYTKTSRIYTGARMNNSRSNVYRGGFRKSVKACEFTHVSVFMRTRRADLRFPASRILCRFQTGNAGAYDLVCMPAMRDLGSLQGFYFLEVLLITVSTEHSYEMKVLVVAP